VIGVVHALAAAPVLVEQCGGIRNLIQEGECRTFFLRRVIMAGEKIKTGNRGRTRVVVKRDQSGAEDVQKKPDTLPKTSHKVKGMPLHPDTGSPVADVNVTKASSTAVERIASGIESIFRPIAKELIKGGIVVADSVSEFASETGEKFKDLLAEAKSEVEKPHNRGQETKKAASKDSH
jgi:uncharacterized protein YoxC